ncbi:MAG: choice-of-anchor A family protein, partial [Oscillospiraceae bacterium]|nr:choice-of-anchor A family protein [Oscillospiraceae bacterium]
MKKKKLSRRILSSMTAAFLAVTNIASVMPEIAVNAANDLMNLNNDAASATTDVELLIGSNHPVFTVDPETGTIKEAISEADKTYALGIAAEFCVFLSGDFTVNESDSEGRIAIGGNFYKAGYYDWNAGESNSVQEKDRHYEVGNGDFKTKVSLETLTGNEDFAHAIVNGSESFGLVPTSWEKYKHYGVETYVPKRFWVADNANVGISDEFKKKGSDQWSGNYNDYVFPNSELFDVAEQFATMEERSEKLATRKATGTYNEGVFTYTGGKDTAECVYFTLTPDQWNDYQNRSQIEFVDIPSLREPRAVMGNDGVWTTWDKAYIVINVQTTPAEDGNTYICNNSVDRGQKFTKINGEYISRTGTSDNDERKNNHPGVTSLLYNFYDTVSPEGTTKEKTGKLVLGNNFQGTILAPYADVTDNNALEKGDRGHLSGALIAKSFKGGSEFGYRPYTGPYSILGSESGYTFPVEKLEEWGNELAGAEMELVLTTPDGVEQISSLVTTAGNTEDGKNYDYMQLPSLLNYDGYSAEEWAALPENKTISAQYKLQEAEAPLGYLKGNSYYVVSLAETINDYFEYEEQFIPSDVTVVLTIKDAEDSEVLNTKFNVVDTYSEDEDPQMVSREITYDGETFTLALTDGDVDGTKTSIEGITDYTQSQMFTSNDKSYYYNAETMMVTANPELAPTFSNDEGVAVVKVSDADKPLKGATLELVSGTAAQTMVMSGQFPSFTWTYNFSFTPDINEETKEEVKVDG